MMEVENDWGDSKDGEKLNPFGNSGVLNIKSAEGERHLAMANTDVPAFSSADYFIKTSDNFEKDVKDRINWTKEQWSMAEDAGNRLNKLCNSLKYWRDKLKAACEDVSIIFTLFNANNDIKIDLLTIITEIEKVDDKIKVQGFTEFRNPCYLGIYFKCKEDRDYVYERFKMINENYVVYLSWALEPRDNVRQLNIFWLPWTMKIKEIEDNLDKCVKCVDSQKLTLTMMSGRIMQSGKVLFKVRLNDGVSAESIPQVMKIANLEALITVSGRQPMCLNCNELGHISKKCEMRYCGTCAMLCKRDHACSTNGQQKSYAAVLKHTDQKQPQVDVDDWKAVNFVKEKTTQSEILTKEKSALNATIVNIQEKINELNGNINLSLITKPDKKGDTDVGFALFNQQLIEEASRNSMSEEESDMSVLDSEQSEESKVDNITINNHKHGRNKLVVSDIKKGKNRKRRAKSLKETSVRGNMSTDENNVTIKEEQIKNYGKKNFNNSRRIKEDLKFKKLDPTQEFIFTD